MTGTQMGLLSAKVESLSLCTDSMMTKMMKTNKSKSLLNAAPPLNISSDMHGVACKRL